MQKKKKKEKGNPKIWLGKMTPDSFEEKLVLRYITHGLWVTLFNLAKIRYWTNISTLQKIDLRMNCNYINPNVP